MNLPEAHNQSQLKDITSSTPAPPHCQVEGQVNKPPPIKVENEEVEEEKVEEEEVEEPPTKKHMKYRRRKERRLGRAEERLQQSTQLLQEMACPIWLDTEEKEYEPSHLADGASSTESEEEDIFNEWYADVNSMIVDSGTTSTIGSVFHDNNDKFIPTGEKSEKVFKVANGNAEEATEKKLLQHQLRPTT